MPHFNKGQETAIRHVKGPMIALAGPGSGKTTAMVHRIRYLIEEAGVSPANILVVTFTRASAKEMEQRFLQLTEEHRYVCTFGTFHSVFFYILKMAYGYRSEQVLAENDKYALIKEIIRKRQIDCDDEEELIACIMREIGMMKGDMISLQHFYSSCLSDELFREVYREYEQRVEQLGKLDFDDMMVYCYELLKERPDILALLQRRYAYILVDEFQDINRLQYEITKMLAAPHNNLFIVGDDDQSIYGFRGARPEIMLRFKEDYPDAAMTLLGVNYRCSRNIVEGSERLIRNNSQRYKKELKSSRGYEEPIRVHHMRTLQDENAHVIRMIKEYHGKGIPYEQMAVIVRTNVQSRPIAGALMAFNIPFQLRDSIPCIYDHFTVKTLFDYMRAAAGERDRALFLRIMNKPKRYLSRDLLSDPVVDFRKLLSACGGKDWAEENVLQFEYDLKTLAKLKPYAAVHFIRKAIGYDAYLREYAEYRHINAEELYAVLDEVQEMAKDYTSLEEWTEGIRTYREEFEKHVKSGTGENRKGVVITTMHSAKGLEFDAVFLLDANEGMTPYRRAVREDEMEEERRMFYVAMTRARSYLHIYEVKEYFNREQEPSRFLDELAPDETAEKKEGSGKTKSRRKRMDKA